MRTNLFSGAVLGLLCLTATSFAGWDATDKALGHEGKAFRSNRVYYAQPAQQVYRSTPVMSAPLVSSPVMTAPVMSAPVVNAPVVAAAPAAVPQVATTNSNNERRSFSVEPSATPAYSAPRSYNYGTRVNHQPNYSQADTKIRGREGN